ncbi:glutaredoxin domain-containing protein [Conexibacter sp. SYSU D00693]|uniref:glutaredoxin domain-containing protein n=1 Tax=Conexibacter sp. SYSU D00693 TaxID=2812560 RepID=UPI00196B5076|nr:glutaredoxin domain-containing protein [Conexibacter sp. SYSU D00693]
MIEVFQAEWCPYSSMVRERLNELDLPFICRPVAADRENRHELRDLAGTESIPVVRLDDGTLLAGDTKEILAELDQRFPEPPGAEAHRRQLAAHQR